MSRTLLWSAAQGLHEASPAELRRKAGHLLDEANRQPKKSPQRGALYRRARRLVREAAAAAAEEAGD